MNALLNCPEATHTTDGSISVTVAKNPVTLVKANSTARPSQMACVWGTLGTIPTLAGTVKRQELRVSEKHKLEREP